MGNDEYFIIIFHIVDMSRKNNKSIKKRYNAFLKDTERKHEKRREEKERAKEDRDAM